MVMLSRRLRFGCAMDHFTAGEASSGRGFL